MCPAMDSSMWGTKNLEVFCSQTELAPLQAYSVLLSITRFALMRNYFTTASSDPREEQGDNASLCSCLTQWVEGRQKFF
jgi:hypothetical protein